MESNSEEKKSFCSQEDAASDKVKIKSVTTKYETYVFEFPEDCQKNKSRRVPVRIWQIFPSFCASLISIPFGLMLGWPCPSYPRLLDPDSNIPITMDQSAMIAGFLMIGVTVATPFSKKPLVCVKYGIIFGAVLTTCGWIVMWQAFDIYGLLCSRLLVGAGYGYGLGQVKDYINQMCEEKLAVILIKPIILYVFVGLVLSFIIGTYMEFQEFALTCLIINVFVLFLAIFLPSTPRELIKANKIDVAKKLLLFLNPDANLHDEIKRIYEKIDTHEDNVGFRGTLKNATHRKNFIIFGFLVSFQQFTGAPATLIYTQILFRESKVPYEEYFAISYALVFLFSNILGIYVMSSYNKRSVLLASNLGVILTIVIKIVVIYFNLNESYWSYISVIVMYLFITIHTVGLGNMPFCMINEMFPKNCRLTVTHFFFMLFSMGALVITKIFQVLLDQYNLCIPFCLFLCISIVSVIFIFVFVPKRFT